jgi:hypothetical protein
MLTNMRYERIYSSVVKQLTAVRTRMCPSLFSFFVCFFLCPGEDLLASAVLYILCVSGALHCFDEIETKFFSPSAMPQRSGSGSSGFRHCSSSAVLNHYSSGYCRWI